MSDKLLTKKEFDEKYNFKNGSVCSECKYRNTWRNECKHPKRLVPVIKKGGATCNAFEPF